MRVSLVTANDDFITLLVTERDVTDDEADATVEAIRSGAVDALVVGGEQVVMLDSAQRFYQAAVDRMQQGVVIVGAHGEIAYANQRMAALLGMQRERLGGSLAQACPCRRRRKARGAPRCPPAGEQPGGGAPAPHGQRVRPHAGHGDRRSPIRRRCAWSAISACRSATRPPTSARASSSARWRTSSATSSRPIRNAVEALKRAKRLDEESLKMVEIVDRQSARMLALVEDLRRINPKE